MLARYYEAGLGRFLGVDPGDVSDRKAVQSWNRYSYVRNNPMTRIDLTGAIDGSFTYRPVKGQSIAILPEEKAAVVQALGGSSKVAAIGAVASGVTAFALPFTAPVTGPLAESLGAVAIAGDVSKAAVAPSPATIGEVGLDVLFTGVAKVGGELLSSATKALSPEQAQTGVQAIADFATVVGAKLSEAVTGPTEAEPAASTTSTPKKEDQQTVTNPDKK
jgi:uncharacterized protein RhaS with RHS repeats